MTDMTRPTRPDLTCEEVRDLAASFVLGALDPNEADAVRAHLASCADPHVEIAELGSVLPVLAESAPVIEPPAALKARILAAAAAELDMRGNVAVPAEPAAPPILVPPAIPTAVPVPLPTAAERQPRVAVRSGAGTWVLRIAAVLAIALLAGWNLLLQNQLERARTYEENVAAVLDVAGQPGSMTAVLTAEGGEGPAGLAAIADDGIVRIAMRDLPATSGNQVYEAWVIGGDGVPKALGGFTVGETGTAYFEGDGSPAEEGVVLALTLEPGPGATVPSSAPVSLGTATGAG